MTNSSSNPRDPSGGRSDAVIIKDITNAIELRGRNPPAAAAAAANRTMSTQ